MGYLSLPSCGPWVPGRVRVFRVVLFKRLFWVCLFLVGTVPKTGFWSYLQLDSFCIGLSGRVGIQMRSFHFCHAGDGVIEKISPRRSVATPIVGVGVAEDHVSETLCIKRQRHPAFLLSRLAPRIRFSRVLHEYVLKPSFAWQDLQDASYRHYGTRNQGRFAHRAGRGDLHFQVWLHGSV